MSSALDALPANRRTVVVAGFLHCDKAIAEKVNEFAPGLIIRTCKQHLSLTRGLEMEEPFFNPQDGSIHMDERVDDDEYVETFKHELGHFIDEKMNCPSCKEDFGFAIRADLDRFMSSSIGMAMLGDMLGELMESLAMENRYLSDIFSAMFHETETARQRNAVETMYNTQGIPIYGHENDYWTGKNGPKNAVQLEVFADMFAIFAENEPETVQFIEKWFPNMVECFSTELGRGG